MDKTQLQGQAQKKPSQLIPAAMAVDNIAIVGVGLNCVAGNTPIALFGAVGAHLGFTRPDPVLEAPALTGEGVESIMTCAMDELDDEDPNDRMLSCMLPALSDAIESADMYAQVRDNILFYLVVPGAELARGECLVLEDWHTILSDALVEIGNVEIRIKPTSQSVSEHLMFVAEGLKEGLWDSVIFGAVDSLVDELTCMELGKQFRIQTVDTNDGVIPGEAAGFIVLECKDKIRRIADLPFAWLKGISVEEEPNATMADQTRLTGLSQAIKSVLRICDIDKEKIGALTLAMGTEQHAMLEWYQTETSLWPNQASEQERLALQLGEVDSIDPEPPAIPEILNLNLSLGDIGIASIPVAIILACARFEFKYPVCKRHFIVEAGDLPFRGVIYLKHPTNGRDVDLHEQAA